VVGGERYSVRVRVSDDPNELDGSCTCPRAADGWFCKHCVAIALAWSQRRDRSRSASEGERLKSWVRALDLEALQRVVLEEAQRDEALRSRLLLRASGGDSDAVRAAIDRAIAGRGAFVSYAEGDEYANGIGDAIDAVEELADSDPAAAIELAEHALRGVEGAIERVDDSDGYLGDLLGRLQDVHLLACEAARPDPESLAERLFAWEQDGDWDVFHGAAETYAEVLGQAGLRRYRELALERWEAVPARGPGDERGVLPYFRITATMESLARAAGDFEELIDVMTRDLSSPWKFVRVAEACRDAGRLDDAVAWARRGLRAFDQGRDPRLATLLAELHKTQGDDTAAAQAAYMAFAADPRVESWRALRRLAQAAGTWDGARAQAIEHLEHVAGRRRERAATAGFASDRMGIGDELVRVLLDEDDADHAWAAAGRYGASDAVWLDLARRRGAQQPDDGLAVYRRLVERAIAGGDRRFYRHAAGLLGEVRALLAAHDRLAEFDAEVDAVRRAHPRRRALLDELDKAGRRWSRP
jgi:uncharacterized Zn finger protein